MGWKNAMSNWKEENILLNFDQFLISPLLV